MLGFLLLLVSPTLLGTSFAWDDVVCYLVGGAAVAGLVGLKNPTSGVTRR